MNRLFSKTPQQKDRYARATLFLIALTVPLVIFGAISALKTTSNDPRQWLPKSFAETSRYDWFLQHFGSDEIAVVSWPGCELDDPRVSSLAGSLEESEFFDRVRTGQSVIDQLMQPPLDLSRAEARRRLGGILIGPNGKTTCLVLSTSVAGKADRVKAVSEIERLSQATCQLPASELRLAGPTVDAAAIDIESRRLLFQLAGISAFVSFFVASMRLKSIRLAIMILVVAGYSTGLSLAILYVCGSKMNLLMTMLPPLVYILSISSAVHLANYYRDAASDSATQDAHTNALGTAVAKGWLPCVLAAATTSIGLVSLSLSKIEPIQMFGIYSAIGVTSSVGVLFVLLPAALHLFPPRIEPIDRAAQATSGDANTIRFSDYAVAAISRHNVLVVIACLAVMAFYAKGLPSIKSTVRLQDRFLDGSDAINDYQWLETNVGPMVPLEIVIHFDKDSPLDLVKQMRLVAAVQKKIHSLDEPVATMSAINLSPSLPSGSRVRDVIQRKLINRPSTKQHLIDANFLAVTDSEQLWRITARANAIGDLDYGLYAEQLQLAIDPLLEQQGARGTYTGIIPLIYKAQRQLLMDLFRSFLAAFAIIALVLVFVLRSVSAALIAMVPNLFPAVVVFGGLEWIGIPLQIGSVMTASAAMGIAVDDTLHFLTWFRRGIDRGLSRKDAISDAYGRCAGAMMQTTLICCSGLLVFTVSSFVPILHFAWLMVALLLAALIGDLVLLPAILAGPLGRFFEKSKASPNR
ncbi:efflux RND transporter permease subunit [Rubripirellula obstinata]|nr:MMPL family transporter [Rubripirellula obstinata]